MKAAIARMILRMKIGKQKAFFVMKMRAKEAQFEVQLDQTIKMNQKKLLLEQLMGIKKQKNSIVKRLILGKHLRLQLRAFVKLKTHAKDKLILE